ncbi:MAG: DUF512 domain-containing protein [Thermodesulfovibrionales bacterium]|nr:DUF512 domain-containing protein [Thermodesulfovibrionales bacterium]
MSNQVVIEEIEEKSPAEKAGLKKGDILISINGMKIRDAIDLLFYGNEPILYIKVRRNNKSIDFNIERRERRDLGIKVNAFPVKRCRNRCIFCFVDQLPKGLRKTLYIKDDDYRLSFLYGNFVTLTNLSDEDRIRIKEQHLSPLYISVHHTDRKKRNIMLGNHDAPDILKEIRDFAKAKIKMHCQIVLCPGYNDGEELRKTVLDLTRLYPYVNSIAVVPVGITKYSKSSLSPVNKEDAIKAIEIVEALDRRFKKRYGRHIVYAADELYIKAGVPLPDVKRYEEFPQLENGVGLVTLFLHKARKFKKPVHHPKKRIITFTGEAFYPFLRNIIEKFKTEWRLPIDLFMIKNRFFGETVTVAGLLTGRDIIEGLADKVDRGDYLLIPDVTTKDGGDEFLDGLTVSDISRALSVDVFKIDSSPEGLIKALEVIR